MKSTQNVQQDTNVQQDILSNSVQLPTTHRYLEITPVEKQLEKLQEKKKTSRASAPIFLVVFQVILKTVNYAFQQKQQVN